MPKASEKEMEAQLAKLDGPEWDSSDEEPEPKVDSISMVKSKKGALKKQKKKGSKSLDKSGDKEAKLSKVLYIGHIPKEFQERELKIFLQQFGNLRRLRLSRSTKTGNPRGFAFVEFVSHDVAKIVMETLSGYFVGNRRLVCEWIPDPKIKRLFFDTRKAVARREMARLQERSRREHNLANLKGGKMEEITKKLISRQKKKQSQLKKLGIDYDFPSMEEDEAAASTASPSTPTKSKSKGKAGKKEEEQEKEELTPPPSSSEKKKTKKGKRKDSIDSVSSESSEKGKKSKRKDSVGSVGSITSPPASDKKKKGKKRKSTDGLDAAAGDSVVASPSKSPKKQAAQSSTPQKKVKGSDSVTAPQSETKAPKKKKTKKRRSV